MRVGLVTFPGSSGAPDMRYAFERVLASDLVKVIPYSAEVIRDIDLLVIPGGSAFGDYLRPGALARLAPIAPAIRRFAREGKVLGVGNGFQILCELGLLRGRLLMNRGGRFIGRDVFLQYCGGRNLLTSRITPGQVLRLPIACTYGGYYADRKTARELEESKLIAFRFCNAEGAIGTDSNPTGSVENVAGLANADGNVLGIIAHPERAMEMIFGGIDGKTLLEAILPEKIDL